MISEKKIKGLKVFIKDGDDFYEQVLNDFLNYRLTIMKIFRTIPDTKVLLIDTSRGPMVLKIFAPQEKKVERFFKSCVKKDYYENLIKQTDRVRNEGVTSINDYYLLAENKILNYAKNYIMLIEYIKGKELNEFKTIPEEIKDNIRKEIDVLHQHNMVSGDPHHGNFIISDSGVRLIDLSGKKCTAVRKAKDRIDLERHFGIRNELKDHGYYRLFYKKKLRYLFKSIKYKLGVSKKKPRV
jgi:heptose II phosphotransferase